MKKNKVFYESPKISAEKKAPPFIVHDQAQRSSFVPWNYPVPNAKRRNHRNNSQQKYRPARDNPNFSWVEKRDGNFLLKACLSKKTGLFVRKKFEDWHFREVQFYEAFLKVRASGGEVRKITATLETKDRRGKTVNVPLSGDKVWAVRLDEIPGKMIRIHVKCKFRLGAFRSKPLDVDVVLFAD